MPKRGFWKQTVIIRRDRAGWFALDHSSDDDLIDFEYKELRGHILRVLKRGSFSAADIVRVLSEDGVLPGIPSITRDDQIHALTEVDSAVFKILEALAESGRVVSDGKSHRRPLWHCKYSLGTALDRLAKT